MGLELAKAFVTVHADVAPVQQEIRQAVPQITSQLGGISQSLGGIAALAGIGLGISELVGAGREAMVMGAAAQQNEQRLAAAIRATGMAAGFTKDQMVAMAEEMKGRGIVDDDEIVSAMTALTRFRSVSGDTFKETISLAADMGLQMEMGTAGAARMLGRALEDPARGMMMLRRMGVMLNAEEQKQVKELMKHNKLREAQAVILTRVRDAVGGTNAALADTPAGKLKQLQIQLEDLKKGMGKELITFGQLWTRIQISWQETLNKVIPVMADIVGLFYALDQAAGGWPSKIMIGTVAVLALGAAMRALGVGALISNLMAMGTSILSFIISPIGLATAAVVGLGAVLLTQTEAGQGVLSDLGTAFGVLKDDAINAWGGISGAIASGDLGLAAQIAWEFVKLEFSRAWTWLADRWSEFWGGLQIVAIEVAYQLVKGITNAWAGIQQGWNWLTSGMAKTWEWFCGTVKELWATISGWLQKRWADIKGFFDSSYDAETAKKAIDQATEASVKAAEEKMNANIKAINAEQAAQAKAIEQKRKLEVDALTKSRNEMQQKKADEAAKDISDREKELVAKQAAFRELANKGIEQGRKAKEVKDLGPGKKRADGGEVAPILDPGRYGFKDIGTKLQDMLLKGNNDHESKMEGLAEEGNRLQNEQIAATRELKGVGTLT